MNIIYLKPRSSMRTQLHSDTLFGLICWGIATLYPEKDAQGSTKLQRLLGQFAAAEQTPSEKPPFLLSSAFPYRVLPSGKKLHYFPKPAACPPAGDNFAREDAALMKEYKNLAHLPEKLYLEVLSGNLSERELFAGYKSYKQPVKNLHQKPDLADRDDWEYFSPPDFRKHTVMHNKIDRLLNSTDGRGTLFYSEETSFPEHSGLFFLVDFPGENYLDIFTSLANFYSDMGFGGDATSGKGHFDFSIEESPFNFSQNTAAAVSNLSFYLPRRDEVNRLAAGSPYLWYRLTQRKGKAGGLFFRPANPWKKAVNVFEEGGCFPNLGDGHTYGCSPNVKQFEGSARNPEMNIRYNGYALMVPYNMKESS